MISRRDRFFTVLACVGLMPLLGCERADSGHGAPAVEFAAFQGGLGVEFFSECVQHYTNGPGRGVQIKFWSSPRMEAQVQPRILRRNPPDLAYGPLPFWQLVVGHRLLPLDEWLDEPSFDQPGKSWRQTFVPGLLDAYQWQGRTYAIPFGTGTSLLWYDKKLWREHGWVVPRTWEELLAVCRRIKSEGIAPVAFQGKYWGYAQGMFDSILYGLAGPEFYAAVDGMQPGVFVDARYIETARRMQEFATDYFQPGCMAMSHIEAELEFLRHRAALVWCGTYLRNEMKEYIAADFELAGFPWPTMQAGIAQAVQLDASSLMVFADGRSPRPAAEFLRFMTSREMARRFVAATGSPAAIVGAVDGVAVSADLRDAVRLIESAPVRKSQLFQRYPALGPPYWPLFGDLLNRRLTPAEFGRQVEEAAARVRADPAAQRFDRLLQRQTAP